MVLAIVGLESYVRDSTESLIKATRNVDRSKIEEKLTVARKSKLVKRRKKIGERRQSMGSS